MTWIELILWLLGVLLILTIAAIFLMRHLKAKQKKESKDDTENELTNLSSNKVNIILISDIDGTPVYDNSFIATIDTDDFDGVRYIVNEDEKFKELYPEKDSELFGFEVKGKTKQEQINNLKVLISDTETKLKNCLKKPTRELNESDLEDKINIYKIKLKELKHENEGSPLYIGENGMKNFFFKRTSGETIPIRWDISGNSVYGDMAYKKKFEAIARSNLLTKYSAKVKKTVDASSIWLMVINVLWTVLLFIGVTILIGKYNAFDQMYDDAKLIELQTKSEVATAYCAQSIALTAENLVKSSDAQQKAFESQKSFFDRLTGTSNTQPQQLPDK